MSGEGMIIIVVAFLILGALVAANSAHTDALIKEGQAIKRETEFYKTRNSLPLPFLQTQPLKRSARCM